MTPEHAEELRDLGATYDLCLEELEFVREEKIQALADPGYYSELLEAEEHLDARLERVSRRIAQIRLLYEGV